MRDIFLLGPAVSMPCPLRPPSRAACATTPVLSRPVPRGAQPSPSCSRFFSAGSKFYCGSSSAEPQGVGKWAPRDPAACPALARSRDNEGRLGLALLPVSPGTPVVPGSTSLLSPRHRQMDLAEQNHPPGAHGSLPDTPVLPGGTSRLHRGEGAGWAEESRARLSPAALLTCFSFNL